MAAALRLVAMIAAVLLACRVATAQPPTAPYPHPPLDDLVKEYLRLGLPLFPKDAEVMWFEDRVGRRRANPDDQEPFPITHPYSVLIRMPLTEPGGRIRYLSVSQFGINYWEEYIGPIDAKPVSPHPDVFDRLELFDPGMCMCLAVHCKLRGQDALAVAIYERAREQFASLENELSLLTELRSRAFWYWAGRCLEPGTDRKEILRHLKELTDEDESIRDAEARQIIKRLEATILPRTSKPGSAEALIDDLTELWVEPEAIGIFSPRCLTVTDPSYWALVDLGFDAVPALIEHLHDERLTRTWVVTGNFVTPTQMLTVGHVCSHILNDLSARQIGGGYGQLLDPVQARRWFEGAKKIGEEKWLLDHALPTDGGGPILNQDGRPEGIIVRAIGAKYPNRLPAIYRAALKKPPAHTVKDYVPEIVASKLPNAQKVALLEEGAAVNDIDHRTLALEGLAALAPAQFQKHLLATLRWSSTIPMEEDGRDLIALVVRTADDACWEALRAAVKSDGPCTRMDVIERIGRTPPPGRPDQVRRRCLRFLMQCLNDAQIDAEERDAIDVRDLAADQLAVLLGLKVWRKESLVIDRHDFGAAR